VGGSFRLSILRRSQVTSRSTEGLTALEELRDWRFRRLPRLRVRGPKSALTFLNEVGLASLFAARTLNLPCLWVAVCGRRDPQFPHHSHHDPEVGLAWQLKDELPAAGKVFYGKLVRCKPTFVALDLLPAVYRLLGPRNDHVREYRDGLLSPAAKGIVDALHRQRPQDTLALKLATNLARPSQRRAFDAAIAELQQRLYISMREVRYDPFTYVWDLVSARYPKQIARARRLDADRAAGTVSRRYLQAVIYATPQQLAAVVGDRSRTTRTVEVLVRRGFLQSNCRIDGLHGSWLVLAPHERERSRR